MGQEVTMVIVESTSTAIIKKISYDVIDMIALLIWQVNTNFYFLFQVRENSFSRPFDPEIVRKMDAS